MRVKLVIAMMACLFVLGAVIVAAVRGVAQPPPAPGLCWGWVDPNQMRGYWDRCDQY